VVHHFVDALFLSGSEWRDGDFGDPAPSGPTLQGFVVGPLAMAAVETILWRTKDDKTGTVTLGG